MVLPAVLMTVRKNNQKAKIDLNAAAAGALASITFTWIGAKIALGIDPVLLRRIYAAFVLCIAVFYFYQSLFRHRRAPTAVQTRGASEFHKGWFALVGVVRSEEHTSELQSLMRISYAVFCLKKK